MGWASAIRTPKTPVAQAAKQTFERPQITPEKIDWARLVALDFETYYDADYTLSKLSTSEYVRDPRFEAYMVGIKIGNRATKVVPLPRLAAELKKIDWSTHSVLCHNTQFDGFILSHRYKIRPKRLYCSLSMARGLFSNDIGAGLDEVAKYLGGVGKVEGGVDAAKGLRYAQLVANKPLWAHLTTYCGQDVDEMLRCFKIMQPMMPADEMELIHLTNRMFCDPVLMVDIARVRKELDRELAERKALLLGVTREVEYSADEVKKILKTRAERELVGEERQLLFAKRVIGSNERFADLLRAEGVEPPVKLSPAWMKKPASERTDEGKWAYAFAKDDQEFIDLPDDVENLSAGLNLAKVADVKKLAARQARLRNLVDCRLAVKSTTNITRAQRFLTAGADGMPLPVGYAYYRAHTGRWGGNNKMNMQNLTRGGELRMSILAPKGHVLCVADSGQIECRVDAWLWGQKDLLDAFRDADAGKGVDAYCRFASAIYGRTITKDDKTERFVGKVCVLGLGFQMGAAKLQLTLAKGALGGPPIFFEFARCQEIVNTYRRMNHRIEAGWGICKRIIEDMAAGRTGRHGPISWEKETIWLPNGMALKYPDLQVRTGDKGWDEWTYQAKDMRKKIYGGLLCENIVQALARIIVASQMLVIDKQHRIVMTTHDEAVACVKKAKASSAMNMMLKTMKTPLHWCMDIPLNAEGGYAENYSK
jgi:hypothetical protein